MKATYRDVSSHWTGHAEAVHVEFDPTEVSYEDLVNVFWSTYMYFLKVHFCPTPFDDKI